MTILAYAHITLSPLGIPYISNTRTKVEEVVLDHLAYHWDAEEIQRQHPHLTLGQIHSVLAYYYDHQEEMERTIDDGLHEVAQTRDDVGASPLRLRLRAKGLLP